MNTLVTLDRPSSSARSRNFCGAQSAGANFAIDSHYSAPNSFTRMPKWAIIQLTQCIKVGWLGDGDSV